MSIRPMTPEEIKRALKRAAEVAIERNTSCWFSVEVCRADGTHRVADEFAGSVGFADSPEHASTFLLMCAEAME